MSRYLISKEEIAALEGLEKTHFLNENAKRTNKSLGDLTGLEQIGFHIIEVEPGRESTEFHRHYSEEECVYILEGIGEARIGDDLFNVGAGDFIGYRAGGLAHSLLNNGTSVLRCIVVGQRLPQDVADYPRLEKRLYRDKSLGWNLVDHENIEEPIAGQKK